jgi:hypothetical protein
MVQGTVVRNAARELVQLLESRFAREVAEEGAERLEVRVATCLERYGEDAATALKRVGPRAGLAALEKFGAPAAKLLGEFGDEGARLLAIEGAPAVRIAARYGREGVELMTKHRGIAAPIIEQFGDDGVRALKSLAPDSAVTLRRLEESIRQSGRGTDLLGVIETYGDRACQFLWRNKGVIFGAAALAAFLRDPEPFLAGVKEIAAVTIAPVAKAAAEKANWTVIILGAIVALGLIVWLKFLSGTPRAA